MDNFFLLLERRYERLALVLRPGRAREEILANSARQISEVRTMWDEFSANIAERASRLPNDRRAGFLAERYIALLGPAMDVVLEPDGGHLPGHPTAPEPGSAATAAAPATAEGAWP